MFLGREQALEDVQTMKVTVGRKGMTWISRSLLQVGGGARFAVRSKHFLAGIPLKKRGVEGTIDAEKFGNKPVLFYFSAGWCGSCKHLTPKIKKFYEALGDRKEEMEVVWVSRDKEADHLLEYYEKTMPAWNYVPFGDPGIEKLLQHFHVAVIPVVKLANANGDVISERARAEIEEWVKKDPKICLDKWKTL